MCIVDAYCTAVDMHLWSCGGWLFSHACCTLCLSVSLSRPPSSLFLHPVTLSIHRYCVWKHDRARQHCLYLGHTIHTKLWAHTPLTSPSTHVFLCSLSKNTFFLCMILSYHLSNTSYLVHSSQHFKSSALLPSLIVHTHPTAVCTAVAARG